MDRFVSLHNHTCYSLMNSLIKPKELLERAKELGQPAVAVTDTGSLFAGWDALKAARKMGVKLIIGCELFFSDDLADEDGHLMQIILIAKNHQGYQNLLLAHKLAYDNSVIRRKKVMPRLDWNILQRCNQGLIALTGGGGGILSHYINTRRAEEAKQRAARLKEIFGDNLALEVQPNAMVRHASPFNDYEDQRLVNRKLIQFGKELDIKVIAACNAHYLSPDKQEAHNVQLSIGSRMPVKFRARLRYTVPDFYLKTREEVLKFLTRYHPEEAEQICDNTLILAEMCEEPDWIEPKYSNPSGQELPTFPVPNQSDYPQFKSWLSTQSPEIQGKPEDVSYLRFRVFKGLKEKGKLQDSEYLERVEKELDVFEYKNASSYMLIVMDYVEWAKNNDVLVGPGRGSAGGSLVAYLIGIHEADSIKYGLIFERFYNKFKKDFSDIDVDFSQKGKPKVEQYIIDKYGDSFCAKISNYLTLTPKPYARAISKAFLYGGDRSSALEIGDLIAESIPDEYNKVTSALEGAPLFKEFSEQAEYSHLRKFAPDLQGLPTNLATHAGGMVIGERPLHTFVSVRKTKENDYAVELEKDRTEEAGLVKMDILGLSTLDIIDDTLKIIQAVGKPLPEIPWDYDRNDKATYDLISSGDTFGVFQFGKSATTQQLCVKVQPRNMEDLAVITAMARPGFPKESVDDFIKAREEGLQVDLLHSSLNALQKTHGFVLFDEILLELAKDVAGWDYAKADRLRKFVKSKGKNPEKDKKLREDFIQSTIQNGIDPEMATRIWDEVLSVLGSYAFNKSHAIMYSFISYQTAYLKAHYPLEFMTANLIHEDESGAKVATANIVKIKRELRHQGIKIIPPDVNKSFKAYKVLDNQTLMTGFRSLKYMGKDAIPDILEKRPFSSFEDFMSRIDNKKVKVPSIQSLAASGALDSFGLSRKQIFLYAKDYRQKLQAWEKRKTQEPFHYPWPEDIGEWSLSEKYAMEMYYLGEGFSCGFKEAYQGFFDNWALDFSKLPDLFPDPGDEKVKFDIPQSKGIVEGVITDYFEFKVKNEESKIFGEIMAKMSLEDIFGNVITMTLFPDGVEEFKSRLRALTKNKAPLDVGTAVHVVAQAQWYQGEISLVFEDLIAASPLPSKPQDLKHKKVSMRVSRIKKKKTNKVNPDKLADQIESELILEGKSD